METRKKTTKVVVSVLALAALCVFSLFAVAGDLEPSAPPGPTMKTLHEIEPRTLISNLPYTISASGSYYLTGNLTGVSGHHGITIDASNVTLDLKGYSLIGVGGSLDGINVTGETWSKVNLTIRNGTIRNWGGDGVDADSATNIHMEGLKASYNGGSGLVGFHGTIKGCGVYGNSSEGIHLSRGLVIDCTASQNGVRGILVQIATVVNCYAFSNDQGIQGVQNAMISNCTAERNYGVGIGGAHGTIITSCSTKLNEVWGIAVNGGTISNCTAELNHEDGIRAEGNSLVIGNTSHKNGAAGFGAGIFVLGTGNRVEGNVATENDRGIWVLSDYTGNLIIKNSARDNTVNYVIPSGNTVGPIISGGGTISSTNPWANFEL